MKGDFSRDSFDRTRHYSRVLMQQGRVQLDADWNEQTSILWAYLRGLTVDLLGPHGGPHSGPGFQIITPKTDLTKELDAPRNPASPEVQAALKTLLDDARYKFVLGSGRYYVDGFVCENERDVPLEDQPDHELTDGSDEAKLLNGEAPALVYLDVWERHVTALEDAHIREVALGGPDTTTRARVLWQVRLSEFDPSVLEAGAMTDAKWEAWKANRDGARPRMRAQAEPGSSAGGPCSIPPESKFRGTENQLYRVEIHQGTNTLEKPVTFKWSRENGSVLTAWTGSRPAGGSGLGLEVMSARDFVSGGWVELLDDEHELEGQPGTLVQVLRVDGDALVIDPMTTDGPTDYGKFGTHPKIRRWDQVQRADLVFKNGAITVPDEATKWIELEGGIRVQFQGTATTRYRTGDYWLIPARVLTGQIEWPGDSANPDWLEPHGVTHHYAPIAWRDAVGTVQNLRRFFNRVP
jgi:Family of unknown function (DUF6519)